MDDDRQTGARRLVLPQQIAKIDILDCGPVRNDKRLGFGRPGRIAH